MCWRKFNREQIIKQEGVYVSLDTWNLDGGGTNGKRLWADGVWFVKLAQLKNCWTWSAIPEVYDGSSERDGNIQAFQNCWKASKVSWLF